MVVLGKRPIGNVREMAAHVGGTHSLAYRPAILCDVNHEWAHFHDAVDGLAHSAPFSNLSSIRVTAFFKIRESFFRPLNGGLQQEQAHPPGPIGPWERREKMRVFMQQRNSELPFGWRCTCRRHHPQNRGNQL